MSNHTPTQDTSLPQQIVLDDCQLKVESALQELASALERAKPRRQPGFVGRLLGRRTSITPVRGLYVWGTVGRGKTMLMDLFYDTVDFTPKRRVHFHAFMQDVHRRLHDARQSHAQDAIAPVARALAKEARLLCLDEMQITDIADAMIVGRLFEALFAAGVVVITTSSR